MFYIQKLVGSYSAEEDKPGAHRNQGNPPYPCACLLCAGHCSKGYRGHRDKLDPASALGNQWASAAKTQAACANRPREAMMEEELLQVGGQYFPS